MNQPHRVWCGYFFPDLDVLFWGIGSRGRWLAQSGMPEWGAERAARALLHDPVGGRLTEEKGAKWKARRELYQTVAAPLLTGFSAGLGVRLVQEALDTRGLPGRIVVGGQLMVWERAWMLGNGIWCFSMGKDLLMVTLGRAQSESSADAGAAAPGARRRNGRGAWDLRQGCALAPRVCITPPIGIELSGYLLRDQPSTGIRRPMRRAGPGGDLASAWWRAT